MHREIKFRAIIDDNTQIFFTLKQIFDGTESFSIRELLVPWLLKGNIPNQFTGIKDRSNIDIYEGDILKIYNNSIKTYSSFCGENDIRVIKFIEETSTHGWELSGFTFCKENKECFLIIGNIFQNPELLAQTEK